MDDAEALLAAVAAWGRERRDVRAVLLVGSQARADTPADQWSDTDLEARLSASAGQPPTAGLPDQAALDQVTNDFWYHLLWAARKLRRGEVWIATQTCNCYLKGLLVTLLGWHTTVVQPLADTWYGGRFLERWADPQELRELGRAYAGYDPAEVARCLWSTAEQFQRLERECTERLGFAPSVPHQQVRRLLREILGSAL